MRLLLLGVCAAGARAFGGEVRWAAKATSAVAAPASFVAWFGDASSPVNEAIVGANDAISNVRDLGGGTFEATVAAAKFPLVTLTPTMTFTCARESAAAVRITLDRQEMRATGPGWATRVVVAMASIMDTTSTSVFRITEDGALACEADVVASFSVPRWVPVPLDAIQNGGQGAIAKQVETDVATMVANLLASAPGPGAAADGG